MAISTENRHYQYYIFNLIDYQYNVKVKVQTTHNSGHNYFYIWDVNTLYFEIQFTSLVLLIPERYNCYVLYQTYNRSESLSGYLIKLEFKIMLTLHLVLLQGDMSHIHSIDNSLIIIDMVSGSK
jgi:hypothetical protein